MILDREAASREDQGSQGAGSLHGRDSAHDDHRLLRHQRHRARHRLPAAPFARACSSSTTAARRTARASCCSRRASFPTAAPGSTSSSTRRTILYFRVDRRRKMPVTILLKAIGLTPEQILATFFEFDTFHLSQEGHPVRTGARAPARRSGQVRHHRQGRQGHRRQGQAHHRQAHPRHGRGRHQEDRRAGRFPGRPRPRRTTSSMPRPARSLPTPTTRSPRACWPSCAKPASSKLQTLYINDLDRGAYISSTLRIDETADQWAARVAIYRMMRPGEPPTEDAVEIAVPRPVLLRGALRPVGRRPHEVQPPRRPRRADGAGDAVERGHRRRDPHPGRAAQRPRRDRRHRSPRQPPRAFGRRTGREPVPRRPGARRARRQGAPEPGRIRQPDAARPDQRQADFGGDQGVLRLQPAVAVHGPDQPAVGDHAQAPRLGPGPGRPDARARRLRGARRASDPLRPRLPDRDAGRPEHRPDQLAGAVCAHQRVRLHGNAVPQGGEQPRHRPDRLPVGDRGRQLRHRPGQCRTRQEGQADRRTGVLPLQGRVRAEGARPKSSTWTWRRGRSFRWPPR